MRPNIDGPINHYTPRVLGGMFDSGLVVVVCVLLILLTTVFSFLLLVEYEWCHVLFKNNTVSFRAGDEPLLRIKFYKHFLG